MAILQDYEVVIAARPSQEGFIEKCAGRVFREWPDPKAITGGESELVENYIKSIPGMKYQIQVYLKPSFDLFEADEVWVQLIVDCGRVYACETFTKSQVMENKTKKEPFILQYMYTQEGMNYYRNFFTFGNLMSDETIDIEDDHANRLARVIGRIIVQVDRVTVKKLPQPRTGDITIAHPWTTMNLAKAVVKDRHVGHATILSSKTLLEPLNLTSEYERRSYKGHNCKPAYFHFRYRSDLNLQKLGIIPKKQAGLPHTTGVSAFEDDGPDEDDRSDNEAGKKEEDDESDCVIVKVEENISQSDPISTLQRENARLRAELAAAKAANEVTPSIKQDEADRTTGQSAKTNRPAKRRRTRR